MYRISFKGGSVKEFNSLVRKDLSDADLSEADLSYADLSGADLSEADLRAANLSGANLSEADLSHCKGTISFQYLKHFAFAFKLNNIVYAKIGCRTEEIDYWVDYFGDIGKKEKYCNVEIEAYGDWLKWVKLKSHKLFK